MQHFTCHLNSISIYRLIYFDLSIQLCKTFSSTQGGEITVYGLTETAWQISSVGLHVEKHRHDYRLKHPLGKQDQ